jgi:hypothetical protein
MHIDDPRMKPLLKNALNSKCLSMCMAEDEWMPAADSTNDGLMNSANK